MESTLRVDKQGHLFINDIEIPYATLVDVSISPMEYMEASIRCTVTAVDIPGYPPIRKGD